MARVRFHSAQFRFTDGLRELEIDAENYRSLRAGLLLHFPDMPTELLDDVIVAIDGEIVHKPFLEPLAVSSEVVFVGRMAAG